MQSIWLLALLRFFLQVNAGAAVCPFNDSPLTGGIIISSVNNTGDVKDGSPYVFETWTNESATDADFNITLFQEDLGGVATAAFDASWSKTAFLVRVGLHMDEGKKYTDYQNIKAEYAYSRIPYACTQVLDTNDPPGVVGCVDGGVGGDYSYIGIYGWTKDPLVEFYIVDDWLGNAWGDDSTNVGKGTICYDMGEVDCTVGSITVDGAEYNVYKHPQENQYSIVTPDTPTSNFDQYFSVRVNPRQCGTISLTEHFKEWESLGLSMGTIYEAKLLIQTGGGIGFINYTHATVKANLPDDCAPLSDDHYERVGGNCVLKACTSRRKNSLDVNLPCGSADCYWDTQAANTTKCIAQGTPCTNSDQYEQKEDGHSCVLKESSASSITAVRTAVLLLTLFWLIFTS